MSKEFVSSPTCNLKVDVYLNSKGNMLQQGEEIAGKKTLTFSGFSSDITIDDTINTENSEAIHNGISALMWLFSGYDEGNFDELSIKKISTELVDEE